jgi:hypothetical protein
MTKFTIDMTLADTTKGALKFAELINGVPAKNPMEPGAKAGVIYFRKTAFDISPKKLRVTVETLD